MFGDLNADGLIDEEDRWVLSAAPNKFDANEDGEITYTDAALLTGAKYSFGSALDPLTQIEMSAGLVGYRPRSFASAYGRTAPWEDKAEVAAFAVTKGLLPHLYRKLDPEAMDKAYQKLEQLRKKDPILARKIEILAVLFGSLENPEARNSRFVQAYGSLLDEVRTTSNKQAPVIIHISG